MLSNIFFGCIIFLITNLSLLYTSHLLVRRFFTNAPSSVRLVATGVLFYSFIILIFQVLSPFHAITRTWVIISCIFLALIFHFRWGAQRNIQADLEPVGIWIRDGLTSRWSALLIICGFVVLLSFSRALLIPPAGWDALAYHLTFAALWIKKGTLLFFKAPGQIITAAHYPINGEIFASWLLLPFHNDLLVNTMNFPITLLGGISCYAIAREFGLTRKEASWVPALICFTPMIYVQIILVSVDTAAFTFCSASVLFALRYLRRGCLNDGILTFIAAGISLGIKYTTIPIVGLIFIATVAKTIVLVSYPGPLKKLGLILLGFLIICTCGGKKYILNTIDARNPIFPYPVKILNYKIFAGSYEMEEMIEGWSKYDKKHSRGKSIFSILKREYKKFCYLPLSAGPKFLLFLVLAFISLFARPPDVPRKLWYLMSIVWIIPIVHYLVGNPASPGTRGKDATLATRYLAPSIALFTIQGLVVMKKFSKHFKETDFFFVALVAWDLLFTYEFNITHIQKVAVLYPIIVLMIPLVSILFKIAITSLKRVATKARTYTGLSRWSGIITRQWTAYALGYIVLMGGLYLLQSYRDNTRYIYYSKNIVGPKKNFVNGWKFLDEPGEKKTIAMVVARNPWFFYPLLGRRLQNDITYISAKYKEEVPSWSHRGLLKGNDFSIWLYNLKGKNVDYIFAATTLQPIELSWMLRYQSEFQLVFSDEQCKIFKYLGKDA